MAGVCIEPAHHAEGLHQPLEVAPVGQQVELDQRLSAPVARGQLDLPALGGRVVDGDQERGDALAHRVPCRLA